MYKPFRITLILSAFLVSLGISAQKIDLDKQYWKLRWIELPADGQVAAEASSYSMNVYADPSQLAEMGVNQEFISKFFNLNGYEYNPDSKEIEIEFEIEKFASIREEIVTKTSESKNANGATVTVTNYNGLHAYICPTKFKAVLNGNVILTYNFASRLDPIIVESASSPDYNKANEEFRKSSNALRERAKERFRTLLINSMANFKQKFDFEEKNRTEIFWEFDLKKAPEFEDFNNKLNEAKAIMEGIDINADINIARKKMEPILTYWKEGAAKYGSEDKKQRKTKYGYLINLARTQLWLEMFAECEATCKLIIENDYDEIDGKNMLLEIKYINEKLNAAKLKTRYLTRPGFKQTPKYLGENITPRAVVFVFPKPPIGFKAYPGYIINYKKERINGQLWVKNIDYNTCLTASSQGRFVYADNGALKDFPVDVNNVDEMSLGRDYQFMRYTFKNNLQITENPYFFRVMYESENYRLLSYYKTENEAKTKMSQSIKEQRLFTGGDVCIMNKKTGVIHPVGSLIAKNAAENTAEFYALCTILKDKILANEFENMNRIENQIKVLEYFEKNCSK